MKVRNQQTGRNPTLLVWAFLFLYPFEVFAESPTVEIKSTVDQVIQILTNPQLQGEEFTINYKLHRVGEDWRVYDLVIENVSLMNNYRSQFNRISPVRPMMS